MIYTKGSCIRSAFALLILPGLLILSSCRSNQEVQHPNLLFGAFDIMPSILGLMDLDIPEEVQGKDLSRAILEGDEDAVDFVPIKVLQATC